MTPEEERDLKKLSEQMSAGIGGTMGGAMIEVMAPMLVTAAAVSDEAKAWDMYAVALVSAFAPYKERTLDDIVKYADEMLARRRQRFGVEQIKARMIDAMADKVPQLVCGKFLGGINVCSLPTGHPGDCHS